MTFVDGFHSNHASGGISTSRALDWVEGASRKRGRPKFAVMSFDTVTSRSSRAFKAVFTGRALKASSSGLKSPNIGESTSGALVLGGLDRVKSTPMSGLTFLLVVSQGVSSNSTSPASGTVLASVRRLTDSIVIFTSRTRVGIMLVRSDFTEPVTYSSGLSSINDPSRPLRSACSAPVACRAEKTRFESGGGVPRRPLSIDCLYRVSPGTLISKGLMFTNPDVLGPLSSCRTVMTLPAG